MTTQRSRRGPAGRKHGSTVAAKPTRVARSAAAVVEVAGEPVDTARFLTGSFDIHGIESSYRELRGLLASGLPVVIDVSQLHAIDTAGVQLLLAINQEAARRAVPLNLRGDSPVFSTAVDGLGLTSAFATVRRHV